MALMAVLVLRRTSDVGLIRAYILCLAVADVGHVASCYAVQGYSQVMDFNSWNKMAWGNIGFTTFLFCTRLAFLTGIIDSMRSFNSGSIVSRKRNTVDVRK